MDAAKKLNMDYLSCAVCMDKFKDACSLGCGHTFCRGCLATYTKTKPSAIRAKSIQCPTCRQMTKVPHPDQPIEDWPKQFKPHFFIQGLLDDFADIGDATGDSSRPEENRERNQKEQSQNVKCEKHNADIDFCCKDCKKAICAKCAVLYHRECGTVVSLESILHEMRTTGIEATARVRSKLQHLKSNRQLVESNIKRTAEIKASLKLKIGDISHKAIQIIKQKQDMLLEELEKTSERTMGQLKEEVVNTESKMQMNQTDLENMTKALESESELELYQLYQMSKGVQFDVDVVPPALSTNLVNELNISDFKESFDLCTLKEIQEELGEPVLLQTIDTRTHYLFQDIFDVSAFTFNGNDAIVVTDCYIKAVTAIYITDEMLNIHKQLFPVKPLSLSKLNERQAVVSLQTKKEFALINVFPVLCIQCKSTTLKLYRCLTVLGPNKLAGACEDPPSVDIIDLSGNILQNFCTAETGLSTIMREPWFISSTSNGHIILTDANSQFGVTALDQHGKVVFKKKIGQKDGTSGITPGQLQGVVVADLFNYKVVELTEEGEVCRDLLTLSDGLQSPYGVCMHRGRLYVAEGEHGVKVFQFKAELDSKS